MLKSLLISSLILNSVVLPANAEYEYDLMTPNIVYSCRFIQITGKDMKCWFTTSKIKLGEVSQPYYRQGKYTFILRGCLGNINVLEENKNYTRVICQGAAN
jgi:hypothetical protein